MISWYIIDQCNFTCAYCFQGKKKNTSPEPINIDKLKENLSILEDEWLIYITGGEPFLEKKIIEICHLITQKHYVSLNTNLSLKNVYEFADKIDPERVISISAAVHMKEREKRDKGLTDFIDKIYYLQKRGFNTIVSYLVSPDLLDRAVKDMEYLKSFGVEQVRMKVFRGIYKGKYYPIAFTQEEQELMKSMESNYPEMDILLNKHNYYGMQCRAGKDFFSMDREGNLSRCSDSLRPYGNFFDSTMKRDQVIRPCPSRKCGCPYVGIRNVVHKKSSYDALILEEASHYYLESRRIIMSIINNPKSIVKVKDKLIEYIARIH